MRCLTLADALRELGVECLFLSRDHVGHLHAEVMARGYPLINLGKVDEAQVHKAAVDYAHWIGVDIRQDIEETRNTLTGMNIDWLIVDHYGMDAQWERAVRVACRRLLTIDDLADRSHVSDVLLNQNLGAKVADYSRHVPSACTVLAGPRYALLRPEFAAFRSHSLPRRQWGLLQNLLITMGGVDLDNATGAVLDVLSACGLPAGLNVKIVMGVHAPWREKVIKQAAATPFLTEVLVNVPYMAKLMCEADLAIGAAGSTSWERCCLGLPTLQLVLAENQRPIAAALRDAGAAQLLARERLSVDIQRVMNQLLEEPARLVQMAEAAAAITDGLGARRVAHYLKEGLFA